MIRGARQGAGLTLIALVAVTASARADVTLTYDIHLTKPVEEAKTATWYLAEDRMAMTTTGSTPARVIYWAEEDRLVIVNDAKKSYMEITGQDAAALAGTMTDLTAQLEKAMAGLTPEQRAKMAETLAQRGMPQSGTGRKKLEIEVLPMSETKTINGYEARKHEVVTNGAKSAEVWAMEPAAATVTKAELAPMAAMAGLLGKVLDAFSTMTEGLKLDVPVPTGLGRGLQGVLVYSKDLEGDAVRGETTLTGLARGDIDADRFEIGDGYTEQELTPAKK